MDRAEFRDALLAVMDRKVHWAWPAFSRGLVAKELLNIHLEQEYATYVRDFPILVGRAYVNCPLAVVRRELIENVYEEETGKIQAGRPHPELFLEYPRGLGMDLARFETVELLAGARRYRDFLDEATLTGGWQVATAVTTLFVEGTQFERGEIVPGAERRPVPPLEQHPLVVYYGLPISNLLLTKAHRAVEGEHRAAAWRMVLDHVEPEARSAVTRVMARALELWLGYRDDVAAACGVTRARVC